MPQVDGVPNNPGLARGLPGSDAPWEIQLAVDVRGGTLGLQATVCCLPRPTAPPTSRRGAAHPNAAAGQVVAEIAEELGRSVPFDLAVWTAPETPDDYAALVTGRSAELLYGWGEAVPAWAGNHRRTRGTGSSRSGPGSAWRFSL